MTEVWAVTMMRDEEDVADSVIRHMLSQEVDGIIVADNLSTDGTRSILDAWAWSCKVSVVDDPEPGYYQSAKMTRLANLARATAGTDDLWIVPFDADELWIASNGASVGSWLKTVPAKQVRAKVYNHYATGLDDQAEPDPFRRMVWRDEQSLPLPKVAVRWAPDMVIHQGNHSAEPGSHDQVDGLEVRHFPYRTDEQIITKIRNGGNAYNASTLPQAMGGHWRGYARTLDKPDGRNMLLGHMDTWFRFADPTDESLPVTLVRDPAPLVD